MLLMPSSTNEVKKKKQQTCGSGRASKSSGYSTKTSRGPSSCRSPHFAAAAAAAAAAAGAPGPGDSDSAAAAAPAAAAAAAV